MSPIEKFLKEYSYKFPKGYPDMKNDQDVCLIESLIQGLGVDFRFDQLIFEAEDSSIKNNTEKKNDAHKFVEECNKKIDELQSNIARIRTPGNRDEKEVDNLIAKKKDEIDSLKKKIENVS